MVRLKQIVWKQAVLDHRQRGTANLALEDSQLILTGFTSTLAFKTFDKFCMVLQTLGPAAHHLQYYHGVKPALS